MQVNKGLLRLYVAFLNWLKALPDKDPGPSTQPRKKRSTNHYTSEVTVSESNLEEVSADPGPSHIILVPCDQDLDTQCEKVAVEK